MWWSWCNLAAQMGPIPGTDASSFSGSVAPHNRSSSLSLPVRINSESDAERRAPIPRPRRSPSSPSRWNRSSNGSAWESILCAALRYA